MHHSPFTKDIINRYNSYCWIKSILHVCKFWRQLAFNNPALWADVSIIDSDNTPDLRADNGLWATGYILQDGVFELSEAWSCVLRQSTRISGLAIGSLRDYGWALNSITCSPFPLLRELHLSTVTGSGIDARRCHL